MESSSSRWGLGAVYSVADGHLVMCPAAKIASTFLKRIAVIADGRQPPEVVNTNEVAPALSIHLPSEHCLLEMDAFQLQQKALSSSGQASVRLAVTRNPLERLVAFWYAKLYLQDPAYLWLNTSIGLAHGLDPGGSCQFDHFVNYLSVNWGKLCVDVHLCPQSDWFGSSSFWTHRLDRDLLSRSLLDVLKPALKDRQCLPKIKQEIEAYDALYHQKLGQELNVDIANESLAIIEKLYENDFKQFSYRSGDVRKKLKSRVGSSQSLRHRLNQQILVRNRQIAGLQSLAQHASNNKDSGQVNDLEQFFSSQHNAERSGLSEAYAELLAGNPERALAVAKQRQAEANDVLIQGECVYLTGLALSGLDRSAEALSAFQEAVQLGFQTPYVLFNLGNCHRNLKQYELAEKYYLQALAMFPGFVECQHNLSLLFKDQGKDQQALAQLRRLLLTRPDYYQASFTMAEIHRECYRFTEAITAYRMCLEVKPDYCDAWNNLGLTQSAIDQFDSAIHSYQQSLSIDSLFKPARQNLAQLLVNRRRHEEAYAEFQLFDELDLNDYETVLSYQGKVNCLLELGRESDALQLAKQWQDPRLQQFALLYVVPILYRDERHISAVRQRWHETAQNLLEALNGLQIADPSYGLLYAHAWSLSNFYLAYQLMNDRPLQELYAQILIAILSPRLASFMTDLPRQSAKNRPIRVGVISPHLNNHNGSIWVLGWLASLVDDPDFEIYTYNISDKYDSGTRRFMAISKYRSVHLTPDTIEDSLETIRGDKLDVLFFTDIGMHPSSKIISVMRLAPVQIQGWGHPVTSGSPTMDFYFSGEGMETEKSVDHYSEKLYRLPHIGLNYERPLFSGDASLLFEKYNLPLNRHILSSMQSTFKYHPSHDWIFAEIASRSPECLITMVTHMGSDEVSLRLLQRMQPHFESRGLKISDHVRVLPRLSYEDYLAFFQISNHVLDTIGWNGGNSSLQALSLGCPIVTLPTDLMRGRHTVAMLKKIGVDELIAQSPDHYVELSVKLIADPGYRAMLVDRIKSNVDALFGDYQVSIAVKEAINSFVDV